MYGNECLLLDLSSFLSPSFIHTDLLYLYLTHSFLSFISLSPLFLLFILNIFHSFVLSYICLFSFTFSLTIIFFSLSFFVCSLSCYLSILHSIHLSISLSFTVCVSFLSHCIKKIPFQIFTLVVKVSKGKITRSRYE